MLRFPELPLAALLVVAAANLCPALAGGLESAVSRGSIEPDETGRYAEPIGGSPVIANDTPYSNALRCIARHAAHRPFSITVGDIPDDTGIATTAGESRTVTQGGTLMAISALAKAGVALVERPGTGASERAPGYAKSRRGILPRPAYYLTGGVTEFNRDIAAEEDTSVLNIALDLRLVDSRTLHVADAVSYQKQILRWRAPGHSAAEPVQLAVRSTIERGVLEMVTRLYNLSSGSCESGIGSFNAVDDSGPAQRDLSEQGYERFYSPHDPVEPRLRRRFQ